MPTPKALKYMCSFNNQILHSTAWLLSYTRCLPQV